MTEEMTMKEYAEMSKRPQYFNLFLESCEKLSMLETDESAGKVIHAIADYFVDGETSIDLTKFSKTEKRCYQSIKKNIDNSCALWFNAVENGRKGANTRWNNKE